MEFTWSLPGLNEALPIRTMSPVDFVLGKKNASSVLYDDVHRCLPKRKRVDCSSLDNY